MHLEYAYYDIASKDIELTDNLTKALKYNINAVSVLPPYAKTVRSILPENHLIKLSCPVDFPLGIMDAGSRLSVAENCIKNGVNILDVVCPVYMLCNRKYDKFREDIKNFQALTLSHKVEIRYILEYRQFTYELLYKVAQILIDFNITTIFPSTGYFLDEISDNILASALINKRVSNINIISTGNLWNSNQVKVVKNSNIYGLRVNSLNGLKLITEN